MSLKFSENGVGNNLILTDEQILLNLKEVQKNNGIDPLSESLDNLHFSVEMETGTGKTYVYLRTIYDLNRKYGFKKFVIVVPGVAIREGMLKNLEITPEHFQTLYDKIPVNFEVHSSKNVSNLRSFAVSNTVQILVINIDAFAKDENIINKTNDKLTGKKQQAFCIFHLKIIFHLSQYFALIRFTFVSKLNAVNDLYKMTTITLGSLLKSSYYLSAFTSF